MVYTIGEMAKMLGVPASTLRYYDKEGLLPFVARSSGGIRQFRESDIEWLRVIGCMKKAGMSIKDIRQELKQQPEGLALLSARTQCPVRQKAGSSQWGMVLSAVFFCTRSAPAPAAQTPQWPGRPVQSRPPGRPYSRPAWKGPS